MAPAVLKVMEKTPDPRLREIILSLITHLHGFIREVRLTEEEFRIATALINRIGQLSNDKHNEAVLMAGSLGVSALVCLLNNGEQGRTETSQNLLGSFWRLNSPPVENGGTINRSETPGQLLFITGHVADCEGNGIAGARVDIWHSSLAGFYENQGSNQADMNLRGTFATDENGDFWLTTVGMSGYLIPTDGVVGQLLEA